MDGLDFVSSLADSLAWPVAVVSCVVILRRQLGGLLPRLQSVEIAGGKAVFQSLSLIEDTIAAVADDGTDSEPARGDGVWDRLMEQAESLPRAAVIEAWGQLEYRLNVASDRIDPTAPHGWPQVGRNLETWNQWSLLRPSVQELSRLAEVTTRSARQPSAADAARYVSVARDLAAALHQVGS